jgi:glycine cleavage system protein P-like pyridoxal-binding family
MVTHLFAVEKGRAAHEMTLTVDLQRKESKLISVKRLMDMDTTHSTVSFCGRNFNIEPTEL